MKLVGFICLALFVAAIASADEEPKGLTKFAQWLTENSVTVNNLGVMDLSATGRGIKAIAAIEALSPIVVVPSKLALVADSKLRNEYASFLGQAEVDNMELLSLHLLKERLSGNSFWAPYLAILPPPNPNLPIYWSAEELQQLNGSIALDLTQTRVNRISQFFTSVVQPLTQRFPKDFPDTTFDINNIAWAYSIVMSRAYALGESLVLVPMLDMVNHGNVANRFGMFPAEEGGQFHIIAQEPIAKDEEVLVSFGNKTNAELLSTYGFVLFDNIHDGVSVRVALDENDPFYETRSRMLAQVGLPREAVFNIDRTGAVPSRLLSMLRINFLAAKELDLYLRVLDGPVSLKNELRVLRRLGVLAAEVLNSYPTTLEQDLQLKETATGRLQLALEVRIGEKSALKQLQHYVTSNWLEFLSRGAENLTE
eukprot:TRINITY_DN13038_c0_g1_i1.p2 TRINITY_DN13038_c0_g1~~TRINITY_DN13038_c0_g1_i1.p2  ORF type:complete len:424 (-),score=91.62 TRINITY_DN13038_c0_g1_i1:249-1520(-)